MTEHELILQRAKSAEISRDFSFAARLYTTLLKRNPDNRGLLFKLGNLYVKSGQNEKALPYYKKIVDKDPVNFTALTSMGGTYRRLKRYDESIAVLQRALDIGSDDAQVYYNLGFTYKSMGRYEDAIDCFKTVVEENPHDVLAFNHLGVIYALRGNFDHAVHAYQRGLKIDPNHPVLQLNLAKAFESLHEYAKAESSYKIALRARPGWFEAIENFAHLLLTVRQTKRAEALVLQSVRLGGRNARVSVLLGDCFLAQSNYRSALDEYKNALEMEPENMAALSGAAAAGERLGLRNDSLEVMRKLSELKAADSNVSSRYAHTLLTANQPDKALPLIKSVLNRKPNDLQALNLLGQYYVCMENDRKAEEIYSEINAIDPMYVDYYFEAADRYKQLGNFKKAEKYIWKFLEKKPEDPTGHLLLATLYEIEKNTGDALNQYHTVLKYDRDNSVALDAVKRLGDAVTAELNQLRSSENIGSVFDEKLPEISMGVDDKSFEAAVKPEIVEKEEAGISAGESLTVLFDSDDEIALPDDSELELVSEERTVENSVPTDDTIDFFSENPNRFDSFVAADEQEQSPNTPVPVNMLPKEDELIPDAESAAVTVEKNPSVQVSGKHSESELSPDALEQIDTVQEKVSADAEKAACAARRAKRSAAEAEDTARDIEDRADDIADEAIRKAVRAASDLTRKLLNKKSETVETPEDKQELYTMLSPAQDQMDEVELEKEQTPVLPDDDTSAVFEETARMLPAIVNMLENTDVADKYPELLDLFKKLHALSDFLPPEKKELFLTGKNRVLLDYVIAKLEGKPGLFLTVRALRKAVRLSAGSKNEFDLVKLTGSALVKKGLELVTDLSAGLEDRTLKVALNSIVDDVKRTVI